MKRKRKSSVHIVCILIILLLIWTMYQFCSILIMGDTTNPKKADVIIVLGAAVWENGPSPALVARVKYAWELYQKSYAPRIILSGGLGHYPPTESTAMASILISDGIDKEILFQENQSKNTIENLKFSKKIMEQNQWKTALIVTDNFHMKRALQIASDEGIISFGAPVKDSILNQNKYLKLKYTLSVFCNRKVQNNAMTFAECCHP